ncbi:MalY/PatB family protein [Coprobacter sp.]|jgi:putative aminotransferase|uniref:MalY/PatB family protein n=1 Tax=Coprobacter sp. TaxID=1941478 RepID=UPI003AB1B8B7
MRYNFDTIIDRNNTDAIKQEALLIRWGRNDLIPLWVADMDLATPPFIMEVLQKRCQHPILGYTSKPDSYYSAIIGWLKKRYNWDIERKSISYTPGIVPGLAFAIKCFTSPRDKILVMPPVYHPFFLVTENENREVVFCPLILKDGQYQIDFEHFEKQIKDCKAFILCNPHNPGGRVWSREELKRIASICARNNVLVFSDEIHADLTFPPYQHIPFASVSKEAADNSLVFMSPSKAFNMAGLASSFCIIKNEFLREKFKKFTEGSDLTEGHVFAFRSVEAAYTYGEEWLSQVLEYLQENVIYTEQYLKEKMPRIKAIIPQASFLIFLDCRELYLSQKDLVEFFVDKAHLALNDGSMFGKEGEGFMRMNIACPRAILNRALQQLERAYYERFE